MEMDAMVLEHMMNPKNYGSLPTANAEGMGKNPQNGEKVAVYMHVKEDEEKPYIDDIRFQAIACSTTVVAGSMLTEEAKGLTLDGAKNLVNATMQLLEKLPPEDAACSEMVALAIKAAVDTYEKRKDDSEYPSITYQIGGTCTPKEENTNDNTAH